MPSKTRNSYSSVEPWIGPGGVQSGGVGLLATARVGWSGVRSNGFGSGRVALGRMG